MFGHKKKYKLPRFPTNVSPSFQRLCEPVAVEELDKLREELAKAYEDMSDIRKKDSRFDQSLGQGIMGACQMMLDLYPQLSAEKQGLVVGAIRYFVNPDDCIPDDVFASGLIDDVMVINHVLEELGIEGHFIDTE